MSSNDRPLRKCRAMQPIGDGIPSRRKRNQHTTGDGDQPREPSALKKKAKMPTDDDFFSAYMTQDTFLFVLKFFVSPSGLVDGDSVLNIMRVSKRWYAMAKSQAVWTVTFPVKGQHEGQSVGRRPSPWIREIRFRPEALNLTNLIGFVNLGRRSNCLGAFYSYTVRERATGARFMMDVFAAGDYQHSIRSAVSAHRLTGDDFLNDTSHHSFLFLPVGMDYCNGRVVRWFNHADALPDWLSQLSAISTLPVPVPTLKKWFRQTLQAVSKIHSSGCVHGHICPSIVFGDALINEPNATSLRVACPLLIPTVSSISFLPRKLAQYTPPELLVDHPLRDSEKLPTAPGDIWSIGCVLAEIVRCGVPLFRSFDNARKIYRMVGQPPSHRWSLRNFAVNASENLRRELTALDEDGVDFISQLLSPDPEKRPTADEALLHPFLSERAPVISVARSGLNRKLERLATSLSWESKIQQLSPTRRHVRMDGWATLVDYICEIVHVFDLKEFVAFQAMDYFDRFYSSYKGSTLFTPRRCQLIAATCLYIASKCGDAPISAINLAFCADNVFGENDVVIAEEAILRGLGWKLSYPTILEFVVVITDALNLDEKPRCMARYISELALQCQIYLSFRPSVIGSCVVALALHCVGAVDPWPSTVSDATGYSLQDLEECMLALGSDIHHVRSTLPDLKMIARKYRKAENGRVALIHIPRVTSITMLNNHRAGNA